MIFELRTYWAAPHKLDQLHHRFRTLTLPLFARHGLQLVGFWTPAPPSAETGDLVYLLACPDQAALEAAWTAFVADPDWQAGAAVSEADGPLVAKVTSILLHATDYSPLT